MIKTIEQHNGDLIQKVTKPNGDILRYQTVPAGKIGDASAVTVHDTLKAARDALGIAIKMVEKTTLPKSAYIQNTKGYRADNQPRKG